LRRSRNHELSSSFIFFQIFHGFSEKIFLKSCLALRLSIYGAQELGIFEKDFRPDFYWIFEE